MRAASTSALRWPVPVAMGIASILALQGCSKKVAEQAPGIVAAAEAAVPPTGAAASDAAGNIRVPPGYRETYAFLGTWAVAGDDGSGDKQMHVVYASPGTAEAYKASGHFPDGAVLVKEVYAGTTQPMTTGTVSHEGQLKGWFVMVRDSRNSHQGNKLWGDGWGWSWFDADKPTKTSSTDYTADCKGCHVPAQSTDWIYTSGYPPLRK
jgi:hypothetical protein